MINKNLFEPYPVKALEDRYQIATTAIYNRLNYLKIKPNRTGKKSFLTLEQLKLMDELHDHLLNGKTLQEFPVKSPQFSSEDFSELSTVEQDLYLEPSGVNLVELVEAIASALSPAKLSEFEELEKAAVNNWLLPSEKIRLLIGVKPKGNEFVRGNWKFIKSGKFGSQSAWRVIKIK